MVDSGLEDSKFYSYYTKTDPNLLFLQKNNATVQAYPNRKLSVTLPNQP